MVQIKSGLITENVIAQKVARSKSSDTLLEDIYATLLKLEGIDLEEIEYVPNGNIYFTSETPNATSFLTPLSIKTFNFVVQNQGASGSGNINIGGTNQTSNQPVSVPVGQMFFFAFTQSNYVTDLSKWSISSPTAKQQYGLMYMVKV